MNPSEAIQLHIEDGIAVLTLNRPAKRNALNDSMREALLDALKTVDSDRTARVLIITGSGAAFCAGGDIAAMHERAQAPAGEVAFKGWARQQRTHQAIAALHSLHKPTIAAVNGSAVGLGADLALSCDFVLASDAATFAWSYVLRGLIPDGGGMYFLPRRVGMTKAKELIFSGKTITAQEALGMGAADRVVAPESLLDECRDFAGQFMQGSHTAIALGKSILNQSFELDAESVFSQGSLAQGICYTTTEHKASVTAFLNKKAQGR